MALPTPNRPAALPSSPAAPRPEAGARPRATVRRMTPDASSLLDPDGSLYVFGYGSLIWKPGFAHRAVHPALLRGFHRRFCIWSRRYRGTPDCPGLVLGLDRGGACRGRDAEQQHEHRCGSQEDGPLLVSRRHEGGTQHAVANEG